MPLPVIAAGARVAGAASARAASRAGSKAGVKKAERHTASSASRQTFKAHGRRTEASKATSQTIHRVQRSRDMIRSARDQAQTTQPETSDASSLKRVRAWRTFWTVAVFVFPFYTIQLLFGLLMFTGFGLELAGEGIGDLAAGLIPGTTLFLAGYILTTVIGLFMLSAAIFISTINLVSWWSGRGLITTIIATVFSFTPFLNIFPWSIIWMWSIAYSQK